LGYFEYGPISILWCAAGEGHGWATINPRYDSLAPKAGGRTDAGPMYCPEHREQERARAISKARLEGAASLVAFTSILPDRKKCHSCSEREGKPVFKPQREFRLRRYKIKSTPEPQYRLSSECIECEAKRTAARRAKHKQEDPEGLRRRETRNRARSRNKRYKTKQVRVDAAPFVEWWRQLPQGMRPSADKIGDGARRRLDEVLSGRQAKISLDIVYQICDAADRPDVPIALYSGMISK
jgi:hypothetical protein